jgi:hypothetical protein
MSKHGLMVLAKRKSRSHIVNMDNIIRVILTDLERVRKNLLTLSDDIWLNIDHNDSEAMKEGVQLKLAYNQKMAAYDKLSSDLSVLIQQFTNVHLDRPAGSYDENIDAEANQRLIRELDRAVPHRLNEDFRYKRPYGFVLRGRAFKDIVTWRRVYELVCQELNILNPELMAGLPDNPDFVSNRGNRAFTRNPSGLRAPMEVTDKLFAEVNLSANSIRDNILLLLHTFGIPKTDMKLNKK